MTVALALLSVAALTRLPLFGLSLGESDSARYLIGVEQWLRLGPHAPYIYAHELSPGYYALCVALVRWWGAPPLQVMNALSAVAALASAPILYWLGCQVTSRTAAATGTILILLAPGTWWLGIEPHPQQLAIVLLLLALGCALATGWGWKLGAALLFAACLLCKSDLILLGLAFPALLWPRGWRRRTQALAIPTAGLVIFFAARAWLLGQFWGASQNETWRAIGEFLQWPTGAGAVKQVVPLVFTAGLASFGLVMIGIWVGSQHSDWRRRWTFVLAAWLVPGLPFWLLMRGNNSRHMAVFLILPMWAACEGWLLLAARHHWPSLPTLATIAALALALNWALVPPNSNVTLYPSANVMASAHDLAQRTAQLQAWLDASHASCYLGNGTLPYLELASMNGSHRPLQRPRDLGFHGKYATQIGPIEFIEVNSPAEFLAAVRSCRGLARSLEYTAGGQHLQFLGQEWHTLPLARRWYPAAATSNPYPAVP